MNEEGKLKKNKSSEKQTTSNIQLSYTEYERIISNENSQCNESVLDSKEIEMKDKSPEINRVYCLKMPEDKKIDCLVKYFKLIDLKSIARQYQLPQSGTKSVISKRITNHFQRYAQSITIQRIFRGHLIRCWLANGFIRRIPLCLNETDGYTLEPLDEIPLYRIVCIKERYNNHTYYYAFDVVSLIPVIKQTLDSKRVPVNIYTRNELTSKTISKLILLYYMIRALFPSICSEIHTAVNRPHNDDIFMQLRANQRVTSTGHISNQRVLAVAARHEKQLSRRIEDLFNEIHYLGNYVNSDWFKSMNVYECITFYEWLAEIWYNRMDITIELRQRINPLRDPLSNTSNYDRWGRCNTPEDVIRICVESMEYMVLDGVDEDARKIGAMYVLCALSAVSNEVRTAFPWLYDTIA